jgi:hypothetical protein
MEPYESESIDEDLILSDREKARAELRRLRQQNKMLGSSDREAYERLVSTQASLYERLVFAQASLEAAERDRVAWKTEAHQYLSELESVRRIAQAARDFNTLPTSVTAMHLRQIIEELDADIRVKPESRTP